ncbi:MAG: flagellar basal-body MS-ring/collar protein FliF [Burkholderiales bacterium]
MATQVSDPSTNNLVASARGFSTLPGRSKVGLIVGLAALLAAFVATMLWVRTPEYRVLFSNLSDRDGGAIVASLGQMNIPYRFTDGGGAILVPATQVHDVRLRLASQGLPKGSNVGFELIETQRFGITQFQEQINYQRALEGELSRSIQSLSAVQNARVHLAIPKQSVFLRESQKPTASILLTLYPGKTLDRTQVSGIVHLVASSIPDLQVRNVSVLDQSGSLLSSQTGDGEARLDPSQLAYTHSVEASYIKRISEILEPIVGRNNFRAQVTADVDFTVTEFTDEQFKPNRNQQAASIRSEQWNESSSASGANGPQGVPGALSNQPPGNSSAPIVQAATQGPAGAPGQAGPESAVKNPSASQRSTAVNYEVDKSVRHTRAQVGGIKRLSTAVVVNFRKPSQANGKPEPLKSEEVEQIEAVVREAIGFSQERGDTLRVTAAPFSVDTIEATPELPLWKRPEMLTYGVEIAKWILGMFALLIILFGVLRPMLRQLASNPGNESAAGPSNSNSPAGAAGLLGNAQARNGEDAVVTLSGDGASGAQAVIAPEHTSLGRARALAKQDPRLVATVVRSWVNNNG